MSTTAAARRAKRPRALAYLRVSTGVQERGEGLEVQRERVSAYADAHDLELVDTVREVASGGVQADEEFSWQHRPILLKLMERAAGDEFDVLLVARLDRLSRDFATLTVLERRLQRYGVEVVSAAEENGDGPIAEYLRGNLALIAQLERAMIRDRLEAGKAVGRRQGRHVHGRTPFGYRQAGRGRLEPIPELAALVERIFTDARDGLSPSRVARMLNEDGIPGPSRKRGTNEPTAWTRQAVWTILRNPVYKGEHSGVRGAQPAIVSARAWNAAQNALAKLRRT